MAWAVLDPDPFGLCVLARCDPVTRARDALRRTHGFSLRQVADLDMRVEELADWRDLRLDFAIVGIMKGGTTTLATRLSRHPEILIKTNPFGASLEENPFKEYMEDIGMLLSPAQKEGSLPMMIFPEFYAVDGEAPGRRRRDSVLLPGSRVHHYFPLRGIVDRWNENHRGTNSTRLVGLKHPAFFSDRFVQQVLRYMRVRQIVSVRHPVDMCYSYYRMVFTEFFVRRGGSDEDVPPLRECIPGPCCRSRLNFSERLLRSPVCFSLNRCRRNQFRGQGLLPSDQDTVFVLHAEQPDVLDELLRWLGLQWSDEIDTQELANVASSAAVDKAAPPAARVGGSRTLLRW